MTVRRRTFKDTMMQRQYDACMQHRPKSRHHGIGQAWWYGYEHPDDPPGLARCGARFSLARAAWAAGVDCRRIDDAARAASPGNEADDPTPDVGGAAPPR